MHQFIKRHKRKLSTIFQLFSSRNCDKILSFQLLKKQDLVLFVISNNKLKTFGVGLFNMCPLACFSHFTEQMISRFFENKYCCINESGLVAGLLLWTAANLLQQTVAAGLLTVSVRHLR